MKNYTFYTTYKIVNDVTSIWSCSPKPQPSHGPGPLQVCTWNKPYLPGISHTQTPPFKSLGSWNLLVFEKNCPLKYHQIDQKYSIDLVNVVNYYSSWKQTPHKSSTGSFIPESPLHCWCWDWCFAGTMDPTAQKWGGPKNPPTCHIWSVGNELGEPCST